MFERECKLVVFAHHKSVLDAVAVGCVERGVKFIRIDGLTDAKQKHAYCKQFAKDPATQLALLSITAAGVGLSFTAASRCVFAELCHVPGDILQAEDRMHRLGQTRECLNIYCVAAGAAGGYDERLWGLVKRKVEVITRALDQGDMKAAEAEGYVGEGEGGL